jgi:nickel/cobalt transporter (NicO) family protein
LKNYCYFTFIRKGNVRSNPRTVSRFFVYRKDETVHYRFALMVSISASSAGANPFMGTSGQPRVAPVQAGGQAQGSIIRGQLALRQKLADYLDKWRGTRSTSLLLFIVGVSFLYGILHALGPGHRKTVVFAIYMAREAPWWGPVVSSLALAGLHGGAAIVLLLAFP